MGRRGRRGRKKPPSKKKQAKGEIDEEEGEAGDTVVHMQCPNCKKLFKNLDDLCPYCDYDTTQTPTAPTGPAEEPGEDFELKHISIYIALILTIFTGLLFVYAFIMPDTGEGGTSALGFVLLPFAIFLFLLMGLLFFVQKRSHFTAGIRSKLVISALLGILLSGLIIGVGGVGQFFVDTSERTEWLLEAKTVHNLFIMVALFSLVLLMGYVFFNIYGKRKHDQEEP